MTSKCEIDADGNKIWYNSDGQRHREDGPAVEWTDGFKSWCINDKLHRLYGPAVEYANGDKVWYINGKEYTPKDWLMEVRKIKLASL